MFFRKFSDTLLLISAIKTLSFILSALFNSESPAHNILSIISGEERCVFAVTAYLLFKNVHRCKAFDSIISVKSYVK